MTKSIAAIGVGYLSLWSEVAVLVLMAPAAAVGGRVARRR
jgi:hypothetical protein